MIRFVCKAVWVSVVCESHVEAAGKLVHHLYKDVDTGSGCFQDIWVFWFHPIGSIRSLNKSFSEVFG